jgi:hypothetical protein
MSLKEYDVVRLRRDLPQYRLKKGAIGAVVMVYDEGKRKQYEVEFSDDHGGTLALETLDEDDIEIVTPR